VLTSVDRFPDGSATGWYLPEAAHPYTKFKAAGLDVEFASITGTATCDPNSVDASKEDAESMAFWEDAAIKAQTVSNKKLADCKEGDYDAIYFAGGFGTMWDFPESEAANKIITETLAAKKPVAAVCHGPIVFANVKDENGLPLLEGKECTGFTNAEEQAVEKYDVVSKPSGPGSCEDVLGAVGKFKDAGVFQPNVCVAGMVLTGQNPPSAGPLADALIVAMEKSEGLIGALKIAAIAGTLLSIMDLNDMMVFPYLAAFFMERDVSKAAAQGAVGSCFLSLSIGMIGFSMMMPKIMPKIGGPSRTLLCGILMFGVLRFLTAALPLVGTGAAVVFVTVPIFFLQGCVYAFSEIGALTWTLYATPAGHKTAAMAALTAARMMGGMFGAPVGGILFDLMGWAPTNIVGGLLLIAPVFAFHKDAAPRIEGMEEESGSGKPLTQMPKFALVLAISLIALIATYAPVPYFQPFFKEEYGLSKSAYGLIFMFIMLFAFGGGSALGATLVGTLGEVKTTSIGAGFLFLSYAMFGPSTLLPFLKGTGLWEGIASIFFLGLGASFPTVVCPPWALQIAQGYGMSEEEAAVKTASYTILMMAISMTAGPVPASALAGLVSIPWASTIMGVSIALLFGLCMLAFVTIQTKEAAKVQEMV